jgi:hypothetical protein
MSGPQGQVVTVLLAIDGHCLAIESLSGLDDDMV